MRNSLPTDYFCTIRAIKRQYNIFGYNKVERMLFQVVKRKTKIFFFCFRFAPNIKFLSYNKILTNNHNVVHRMENSKHKKKVEENISYI